ncbi:MAG: hypothetical protein QOE82_2229 [Thermoanaerobaculia bacterium]|nr:hypothetical protein [Thermoanaerobaculia bacterium]
MDEYALKGPQVQPDASYWGFCRKLCIVPTEEILKHTDDKNGLDYFPPWKESDVVTELDELIELSHLRDDPCALVNTGPCKDLPPVCGPEEKKPPAYGCRQPISRLFNLPAPLGAPLLHRLPGEQIIRTGRGMARAVESETPGLYHRQALSYLITMRHWSPPRQALVWAALDVAITSALQAAWYYKWLSPRDHVSRRQRPIEYARKHHKTLNVLFDCPDELNPAYNLCPDGRPKKGKPCGDNLSGTPRHPAYPSGHSTYSGAASEILSYFFGAQKTPAALPFDVRLESNPNSTIKEELDHMADNIGMGRLWAGIHWRSDHEAGMKLGRVVARLVIRQLLDMGSVKGSSVNPFILCPPEPTPPKNQCDFNDEQKPCDENGKIPTIEDLTKERDLIVKHCGEHKGECTPCDAKKIKGKEEEKEPKEKEPNEKAMYDMNRGTNRGGRSE